VDDLFALILPGGWASDKWRRYSPVTGLVRQMEAAKKPLAIICHGGLIAISAWNCQKSARSRLPWDQG
jgi:protease I